MFYIVQSSFSSLFDDAAYIYGVILAIKDIHFIARLGRGVRTAVLGAWACRTAHDLSQRMGAFVQFHFPHLSTVPLLNYMVMATSGRLENGRENCGSRSDHLR